MFPLKEILLLIVGGCMGALLNQFLHRDGARSERLRLARIKVAKWREECGGHPAYLHEVHERLAGGISQWRHEIVDDLRWWRKRRFMEACDAFMNLKDEDVRPVVTMRSLSGQRSAEETQREKENWLKPGILLRSHIDSILELL